MAWTTFKHLQKGSRDSDSTKPEFDTRPTEDLNRQLHVNASTSWAYRIGGASLASYFSLGMEGEAAVEAMRGHLGSLLPEQLIQDAYGTPTPITKVPTQHLAKLQAKVWCDLPRTVAAISNGTEAKITDQDIVTARAVSWLSTRLSKNNGVFVLQPSSTHSCQFALCGSLYITLGSEHAQMEVTVEPLVDWMTLDPVRDVTTIWINLYRRNKRLFQKYSLQNSKFLPSNPLRLCLRCLLHLADSRNEAWRMVKARPDVLYTKGLSPWRGLSQGTRIGGTHSTDCSDPSILYTRGPMANHNGFDPNDASAEEDIDCSRDAQPSSRSGNSDVQQESTYHENQGPPDTVPHRDLLEQSVSENVSESSPQHTLPRTPHHYIASSCTIWPAGASSDDQHSMATGWNPINRDHMAASSSHTEYSETRSVNSSDEMADSRSEEELESDDHEMETEEEHQEENTLGVDGNSDDEEFAARSSGEAEDFVSSSDPRWPSPNDSTAPIPARRVLKSEVTPEHLYPGPEQLICSCKKPAGTYVQKIAQCTNKNCFVGWYHYKCLGKIQKLTARHGTLECELCVGEKHWIHEDVEGPAAPSKPLTKQDILKGIESMSHGAGVKDPYGLSILNSKRPRNLFTETEEDSEGTYGVLYHEDEEESHADKKRKEADEDADEDTDEDADEDTDEDADEDTDEDADEDADEDEDEDADDDLYDE